MKATGILRQVDELGRVVLPIELRRNMDIKLKDPLEIFVENDCIILKKYESGCIFCGNVTGVKLFKGKNICPDCIKEMQD